MIGGGRRDVRGWTAAAIHLSPQWHVETGAIYARLMSDAADSAIISEQGATNQWNYGTSLVTAWQ